MLKIVLGVLTAFMVVNLASADSEKSLLVDSSDSTLVVHTSHSDVDRTWLEVAQGQQRRDSIDEAALFLANLVGEGPPQPSGAGQKSDVRIRPWLNGRNSLGVKVEISW
jgi:hypothetical protein